MTPEERKEWEAIRSKGKNYYLLAHDFWQVVSAWVGLSVALWAVSYAFSLHALKTWDFWAKIALALPLLTLVVGFSKMFVWRQKEAEYLSGSVSEQSSPVK